MFNRSVFEETTDKDLTSSAMSYEFKVPRQDDRGPASRHLIPRIYISTLKSLYEKAAKEFSMPTCVKISELYAAGLGLPLDSRLSAFWNCFAFRSKPEYGGNEVEYSDILYTLKHHIKQSIKSSPDGFQVYLSHVQKHFDSFTDMFSVKDSNIETSIKTYGSKVVYAGPNINGRDTIVVYKRSSDKEGYRMYAAFLQEKGRMVPFLKQAIACPSIPSKLGTKEMPNVGTYVVVVGKTVLNAKTVKELAESREEQTEDALFSAWVDQDIFSHSDCRPSLSTEQLKAVKYMASKKSLLEKARSLVKKIDRMDKKGQRVKKANRPKYAKAKSLLAKASAFEKIVKARKEQESAWRNDANIGQCAKFYAFDMYINDTLKGMRFVRAAFINMQKQFKRMGIAAIPMVEVRVGAIKTLAQRASEDVRRVKGAPHNGVIIRTCDNKTVNQTIEKLWYKL